VGKFEQTNIYMGGLEGGEDDGEYHTVLSPKEEGPEYSSALPLSRCLSRLENPLVAETDTRLTLPLRSPTLSLSNMPANQSARLDDC